MQTPGLHAQFRPLAAQQKADEDQRGCKQYLLKTNVIFCVGFQYSLQRAYLLHKGNARFNPLIEER